MGNAVTIHFDDTGEYEREWHVVHSVGFSGFWVVVNTDGLVCTKIHCGVIHPVDKLFHNINNFKCETKIPRRDASRSRGWVIILSHIRTTTPENRQNQEHKKGIQTNPVCLFFGGWENEFGPMQKILPG